MSTINTTIPIHPFIHSFTHSLYSWVNGQLSIHSAINQWMHPFIHLIVHYSSNIRVIHPLSHQSIHPTIHIIIHQFYFYSSILPSSLLTYWPSHSSSFFTSSFPNSFNNWFIHTHPLIIHLSTTLDYPSDITPVSFIYRLPVFFH